MDTSRTDSPAHTSTAASAAGTPAVPPSTPDLYARLREDCAADWKEYIRHPFVQQLGAGTLPLPAYQDYLVQDYLYLVQFARANALAAFTSRRLEDIRASAQILQNVLDETELHLEQAAAWGLDRAMVEATPEKQVTVAYTRYLLDCGLAGDLLELHVALAPCAIGYAEIGAALASQLAARPDHPYGRWIAEYSGDGFQDSAIHRP